MADSIKFTDPKDGTEYVIEYDRDSVRFAESVGLNLAVLSDSKRVQSRDIPIASLMSQAFYAGLVKHQPAITQEQSDDIWSRVTGKEAVFQALLEMIQEPYTSLLAEPDESDPKAKDAVVIKLPSRRRSASARPAK